MELVDHISFYSESTSVYKQYMAWSECQSSICEQVTIMVAISFHEEFLDALLRDDKQQTTRQAPKAQKVPRIKVGDTAQIYIKQRQAITSKPVRQMTSAGTTIIADRVNDENYLYPADCPTSPHPQPTYYAHFIGTVEIVEAYQIHPGEMSREELEAWSQADGFKDRAHANQWFMEQHGKYWKKLSWTVIKWNSWLERYFEPEV